MLFKSWEQEMAVKTNVITKIPWKKMWQADEENVQAGTVLKAEDIKPVVRKVCSMLAKC